MASLQIRTLLLALALTACGQPPSVGPDTPAAPAQPAPLMVFAAMSTREALSEAAQRYGEGHGKAPNINFAGTHVLVRQIEAGAKADVFVSANTSWIEHLMKAGKLAPGTEQTLALNELVFVCSTKADWKVQAVSDLAQLPVQHLSIGDPEAVPAGRYAKEFLQATRPEGASDSLWERWKDRVAPAPNVRAALQAVEGRDDVLGVVYRTDAMRSDKVRVLWSPESNVPSVRYRAAVVEGSGGSEGSERRQEAAAFIDWLRGAEGLAIFSRHGFLPPPP